MLIGLADSPLILTAQSLGVDAPNCSGGSAYIDPSTNDWACPQVVQQQSGGMGMFIVAALIAFVAWKYFSYTASRTVSHVSQGEFDDFVPGYMSSDFLEKVK
jgi:hypothetical protein